jgi:1,4-alpha-glucan branching enzyme
MGATPTKDGKGLELRVWAPHATAVAVVGDVGRHDLAKEGDGGMWAATIDGSHVGKKYRWAITAADGKVLERLDPRGRAVADGGWSVVVDPRTYAWKTMSFAPPARENAIVYEMHVGTFGEGGTFKGAIDRLDALAELGINVIELMPINSFGGRNGWGYNPHSYYAPHAPYGTPDDLRALVDAAHARGIAVISDVVYNHYDGWSEAPLRCFDGHCPNGAAGVYFFEDAAYAKTPWGPRPAFSTKEVADFIVDNVFAWMAEYKLDGFRHDSVSNVRAIDGKGTVPGGVELLKRSNEVADGVLSSAFLIAEDLKGFTALTNARATGGYGFDTQWDGFFHWAVTNALVAKEDTARDLAKVSEALQSAYEGDPFARLIYVESHDTAGNEGARLPVRIDSADPKSIAARKRAMIAAGMLMTAPGVPMLFMGQEMLEPAKFGAPPSPLDWTHAKDNAGTLAFYKDVIKARRELTALAGKNIAVTHVNSSATDRVLVYRRSSNASGDDVMVVANFGGKRYARYDVGLPAGGAWKARIDGDDVRYGADFGSAQPTTVTVAATARDNLPFTGSIALGPYSIVILTR